MGRGARVGCPLQRAAASCILRQAHPHSVSPRRVLVFVSLADLGGGTCWHQYSLARSCVLSVGTSPRFLPHGKRWHRFAFWVGTVPGRSGVSARQAEGGRMEVGRATSRVGPVADDPGRAADGGRAAALG